MMMIFLIYWPKCGARKINDQTRANFENMYGCRKKKNACRINNMSCRQGSTFTENTSSQLPREWQLADAQQTKKDDSRPYGIWRPRWRCGHRVKRIAMIESQCQSTPTE